MWWKGEDFVLFGFGMNVIRAGCCLGVVFGG